MIDTASLMSIRKLLTYDGTAVLHFYTTLQLHIKFVKISDGIGTIVEKQTATPSSFYLVCFDNPPTKILHKIIIGSCCEYVFLQETCSASFDDFQITFENRDDADKFNIQFCELLKQIKDNTNLPQKSLALPIKPRPISSSESSGEIKAKSRPPPPPPPTKIMSHPEQCSESELIQSKQMIHPVQFYKPIQPEQSTRISNLRQYPSVIRKKPKPIPRHVEPYFGELSTKIKQRNSEDDTLNSMPQ